MKAYSWNVLWSNREFERALEYLRTLDFDVLALQEVPERLLAPLSGIAPHEAHALEIVRHLGEGRNERIYSLILSRYPIRASGRVAFSHFPLPLRTQTFVALMKPLGWSKSSDRGAVHADIEFPEGLMRVFSAHLSLSAPFRRAEEFATLVPELPSEYPAIVCGDLNVIEFPFMKPLNWFLGSPLQEALPWHDEREPFERRFSEQGLQNPHRGQITHPFSLSQLDHILISKGLKARSAGTVKERYGSDHRLIWADVVLAGD